jgi:hypothetical protein
MLVGVGVNIRCLLRRLNAPLLSAPALPPPQHRLEKRARIAPLLLRHVLGRAGLGRVRICLFAPAEPRAWCRRQSLAYRHEVV